MNAGIIAGFIVTVSVDVVAHCPAAGIKVYTPVAVLLTVAGLQVPGIPFADVAGRTGAGEPLQRGDIAANVGVTGALTVMLMVDGTAHCPVDGVNVYVPDIILLTVEGVHVPETPLFDVGGSTGAAEPEQMDAIGVNEGIATAFIVTVSVTIEAH